MAAFQRLWNLSQMSRSTLEIFVTFRGFLAGILILLCTTSSSIAADVPAQLLGKTISASFTNSMQARAGGAVRTINGGKAYLIYISSAGRVFVRFDRDNRRNLHTRYENGPGRTQFHFVGGKLVENQSAVAGAMTVQISFDRNYQSCTIQAIMGHAPGQHFQWTGLDGKVWEAISANTYSNERCSISAGNGLQ